MPRKVCITKGCGDWATGSLGRCYLHSKEKDRSITRAGRAIYGRKRWQVLRDWQLRREPLCAHCGAIGTDCDHVVPLAQGGAPYDPLNLRTLCHACHSRVTRQDQLTRAK